MTPTVRNRLFDLMMKGTQAAGRGEQPEQTGYMLPAARYQNGGILPAVPGAVTDVWHSMLNGMSRDYMHPNPEVRAENDRKGIMDALMVAGASGTGSLAATRPANSLGAFGRRAPPNGFEIDYFGTPVQIVKNPRGEQLKNLMNGTKHKAVRRLIDENGDVYVWDAADPALHDLVAESLGMKKGSFKGDMLGID